MTGKIIQLPGDLEMAARLAMPVAPAADGTILWVADFGLGQVVKILPNLKRGRPDIPPDVSRCFTNDSSCRSMRKE
jgi:hypothetical protein